MNLQLVDKFPLEIGSGKGGGGGGNISPAFCQLLRYNEARDE